MSKFCSNCGKEINENATVCVNCGCAIKSSVNVSPTVENAEDKNATTGFIMGLCSLIAWIIPLFGYPVTIIGIIFSSKGLKSENKKTMAVVGLVLSIIFLIITLTNSVLGVMIALNK